MDSDSKCGSPAGMGQLIKYFESQSRRLDRHSFQSCPSSLNPDFESTIKFNGVPILPPAITSSRRDELRQFKKDAVLLEKRLKARHRYELLAKVDSLINQSQVCFPNTSSRQAARQLNFDSEEHKEFAMFEHVQDRLGSTGSYSNLAATDAGLEVEDFGLQTMDSVNSDFMSMNLDSIPKVFSGLILTSVKEQKISYDLDRLSKALNVQDLTSTSGSDISDSHDIVHAQDSTVHISAPQDSTVHHSASNRQDAQVAHNLEEKDSTLGITNKNDDYSTHSYSDNQGRVVTSSVEVVKMTSVGDNVTSTNFEQMQNSLNSTVANRSPSTSSTTDGQWSNRSSPKSLRNAVHFSSFVTEYINTSAGQSFKQPTVVKKKISSDPGITREDHDSDSVLPLIGNLSESHRTGITRSNISNGDSDGGLLDNVSFCPNVDSSPVTSPFNITGQIPFRSQERSETYSSDKENDMPQLNKSISQGYKRSPELGNKLGYKSDDKGTNASEQRQYTAHKGSTEVQNSPPHANILSQTVLSSILTEVDVSSVLSSQSVSDSVRISHATSTDDPVPLFVGVDLDKKASVSESQSSSRSNTNTSESSSSTIRKDSPKVESNVTTNIVDTVSNTDSMKIDHRSEKLELESRKRGKDQQSDSPKKLNTDASNKEPDEHDKLVTPSRNNICRNSYTLSEPSPALVQAHGRPEIKTKVQSHEHREKLNEKRNTVKPENVISHPKLQGIHGRTVSTKRAELVTASVSADSKLPIQMSIPSDTETEGKAEHINKYLNQVQFQNSMSFTGQSWDTRQVTSEDVEEQDEDVSLRTCNDSCHMSVLEVLRSVAESNGSLEQLSVEELLALHQQQMNEKRQTFIRQQQREMEELFVEQRREVMLLEAEIKAAQQQEREQHKFLVQNAPENIKVKSRNLDGEYSPVQTRSFEKSDLKNGQQKSATVNSVHFSDNLQSQSFHQFPSDSSCSSIILQRKSYAGVETTFGRFEQMKQKSPNQSWKKIAMYSSQDSTNDDNQTCVKSAWNDNSYSRTTANISAIGMANKIPEFSHATSSPHSRRLVVLRSPLKYTPTFRRNERVVVPPEACLPEMQVKFDKVTALAKGFLTRCLMKSDKVQELIKTIRDTREFAFSFQTETPIKKGILTPQDRILLERIIAQLQAAVLDIHEIFFNIPISDRLALIEQTRISDQDKRAKAAVKDNMRESGPKISTATLKALERKRKSRDVDTSRLVRTSRPKTAPPRTSSPHNSSRNADSRALRSLQSHSQMSPIKSDAKRTEKIRPDNVKEKQLLTQPKRIVAGSSKSASILVKNSDDSQRKGSVKLSALTNKTVPKFQPTSNKSSSQPLKSWR